MLIVCPSCATAYQIDYAAVGPAGRSTARRPRTMSPCNARSARYAKEIQDGASVLIVQGAIVSNSSKAVEVPRLRFAARNATSQEVYVWTEAPARSLLGTEERLPFRSQIPASTGDASEVIVRFVTPQDSGAR